jgi:hypothetical protein
MSYQTMSQLLTSVEFQGRLRACMMEQAMTFKDDGRADIAALAN